MRGIEKANHNKESAPYRYVVDMLHDTENGIRYEIQAGIRIPCRTTRRASNPVLHYRRGKDLDINKGNGMIVGTDKKLTRANDCGLDRP